MSENNTGVEEIATQWVCLNCKKIVPLYKRMYFSSGSLRCTCGFKTKPLNKPSWEKTLEKRCNIWNLGDNVIKVLNKNKEINEESKLF